MFRAFIAALGLCLFSYNAHAATVELAAVSFSSSQNLSSSSGAGSVSDVTIGLSVGPSTFGSGSCGALGVIGCNLSLPVGDTGIYRIDASNDAQFTSFAIAAQFPLSIFSTVQITGNSAGGAVNLAQILGGFTPLPGTPLASFVELELTTNSLTPGPAGSDTINASFAGTFRIFAETTANPTPVPLPASGFVLLVGLIGIVGLQKLRLARLPYAHQKDMR